MSMGIPSPLRTPDGWDVCLAWYSCSKKRSVSETCFAPATPCCCDGLSAHPSQQRVSFLVIACCCCIVTLALCAFFRVWDPRSRLHALLSTVPYSQSLHSHRGIHSYIIINLVTLSLNVGSLPDSFPGAGCLRPAGRHPAGTNLRSSPTLRCACAGPLHQSRVTNPIHS